jgi:enamine deaminase RidA (YjgF/YER057c/UK114 family)
MEQPHGIKTEAAGDVERLPDMDELVSVQVFCPDVSLYAKFNDVYKTYFGKDYPARAFVSSSPLLRGAHPQWPP